VQDSEGRPTLEPNALTDVLTYFRDAEAADVMPFWITQFSTDDQAWEAYAEQRSDQAITWISRYLVNCREIQTPRPFQPPTAGIYVGGRLGMGAR
jgi:hypothetical protein